MTIRHLRIFKLVCKTGSFTKAAGELYMTQPAVSHAVRELEEELDTRLFDRIGNGISLTSMGELFLEQVSKTLELYDKLEGGRSGLEERAGIRLGSSITIANYWLPSILKEFETIWPDTPVFLTVERASDIVKKLLTQELDLALTEGVVSDPRLEVLPFSSYHLAAACAPGYPASEKGGISLSDLAGERLLLREKGSAIRDVFDSLLRLSGLFAAPRIVSVNSQALLNAAVHSLGITVLPEILLREDLEARRLISLDIPGFQLKNENQVVYYRDKYLSKPMGELIAMTIKSAAPGPV